MNKLKNALLYLIGFFVYTQGFWERFTAIPAQIIIEVAVLVLGALYFRPKHKLSLLLFFLIFVIGLISATYTSTVTSYIKYLRFLFYSYIVIDVFYQAEFTIKQFNHFLIFTVCTILLQGIASVYQLFIVGQQVEAYVGMMSSLGGTTATVYPMILMGICTVIFFFATKKFGLLRHSIILLIILSFCLLGYSSGKRAIYYLVPCLAIGALLVCYLFSFRKVGGLGIRKILTIVLVVLVCEPFYFWGIKNSEGLNYFLKGNETKWELIVNIVEYADFYENYEDEGLTSGRSGTSKMVLASTFSSADQFFYGEGFGSIKDEDFKSSIGVEYGVVGFTRDILSGGFLFCLLNILFFICLILRHTTKKFDPFSQCLRIVLFACYIITHLFYSSDFMVSLKITFLFAIGLAYCNANQYQPIREHYALYLKTKKDE